MARKNPKDQALTAIEIDEILLADAHPNHENHLCHIISLRNMKRAAGISKDAQYICFLCGRAAKNQENLCQPVKI